MFDAVGAEQPVRTSAEDNRCVSATPVSVSSHSPAGCRLPVRHRGDGGGRPGLIAFPLTLLQECKYLKGCLHDFLNLRVLDRTDLGGA